MDNLYTYSADLESPFVTDPVSRKERILNETFANQEIDQLSPFQNFILHDFPGISQNNLVSTSYSGDVNYQNEYFRLSNLESELSGTALIEAGRMNALYLRPDQLKWGNYAAQIIVLMSQYSTVPIWKTTGIDAVAFVNAVEKYQESKGLKPTNKGVIAIGTWSQIQDDLGFLTYDKPVRINLSEAIKDNTKYNSSLWGSQLPSILQYFSSIGLTKDGLPLDFKYFSLIVAKWQSQQQSNRLVVDGALGPKSWAVLKPFVIKSSGSPQTPQVRTPSRWETLIPGTVICPAEPILHGPALFTRMVEAIRTATKSSHYIYILGWMLEEDFELIPGDSSTTLFNLLLKANEDGVEIRIIIWDNIFYIKEINQAAGRISTLRNAHLVKDNFTYGSAKLKDTIRKIRFLVNGANPILDMLSSWRSLKDKINVAQNEGSHHEKVVIVGGSLGLIGFCGGIDLNHDRLPGVDTIGRSIMLHDVHCEVRGHGAWSLLRRFMWRWQVLKESVQSMPDLINCRSDAALPGPGPVAGSNAANVKILQTYNHPIKNIKDRSVRDTLKIAIRHARKSVHFEDQYMISLEIADWLNIKLKESSFERVTILTQDDEIAKSDIQFPKAMRKKFIEHLRKDLTATENAKVSIRMLDTKNTFPYHRKVHSKIYIIDDDLAIIGSANCSSRSMTHDSETAMVFFNGPGENSFARKLHTLLTADVFKRDKDYEINRFVLDKDEELLYDAQRISTIVSIGVPIPVVPAVQLVLPRLKEYLIDIVDPDADDTIPQQEVEFNEEAADTVLLRQLNQALSNASPMEDGAEAEDYSIDESFQNKNLYETNMINDFHQHDQDEESRLTMESVLDETATPIRPEGHVSWAKEVLNKLTHSSLVLNNTLDEPARNVIANFQRARTLPVTSKIDFATERALLESDAAHRYAGTGVQQLVSQYIVMAKSKIEDWTTRSKIEKAEITNTYRDPAKLWAFVLHHMAIKRRSRDTGQFSDPNSYLRTGAHFCIMFDGRIIQLHPFSRFIWHAQCLSHRSVAVEFEGNFSDINGKWWVGKDSTGKDYPTQAQFNSGRFLLCYLKIVLGTTHVLAHRQGSKDRTNDPGPEIWSNVGQWGIDRVGLTDGGVDFKCGDGNPILPQWRTWPRDNPKISQELEAEDFNEREFQEALQEAFVYEEGIDPPQFRPEAPPQFQPESAEFYNEDYYSEGYSSDDIFNRELQYDQVEEAEVLSHELDLLSADDLVTNVSKAMQLNRSYGSSLGWNQYYNEINQLLLPFSSQQNVSLGEEAFAHAVAAWQASKGLSSKDSDGIIGPNTWRMMKPLIGPASYQPLHTTPSTPPPHVVAGGANAQSEWAAHPNIQSRYPTLPLYEIKRNQVITWGVTNPAQYIDSAISEWNANPSIHSHFGRNFDGDPHNSYLNLKRLYNKKGIADPAGYFTNNIVSITFFNKKTPGHRDLKTALHAAESVLKASGQNYYLSSAWSFVPRTFNTNINSLSNHASGKAIDINPGTNPHILSSNEILVIDRVCQSVLPGGFLAESNPDTFRRASLLFKQSFNDAWVSQQTQPELLAAIRQSRTALNRYASNGFFDLPTPLVQALRNAGLNWGGNWRTAKDFMHFELT